MSEMLFDKDLPTRTVQTFSMDEMERVTIRTHQDVEPILEDIKHLASAGHGPRNKKSSFRPVGKIPMNIWEDLQKKMADMNLSTDERQKYMKSFMNGEGACWKFEKSYQI
jgi:hypothetical protein